MNATTEKMTERTVTHSRSLPLVLLRLEGLALLAAATFVYFRLGYTWWVFPLLLLAPDLSALGYLAGPRIGSSVYNLAHTIVVPLLLLLLGWWLGWSVAVQLALIWLAHIGMDRFAGYGLKYPDSFKHNHLDEV